MSQQESKNHSVVAGMYADLERGDVEGVITTLSHDVSWVIPPGLPYGGTYTGREAVGGVFSTYGKVWEDLTVAPDKIVAAGDLVIALGHYEARGRETGKAMRARFAHVWRLEDGVPVTFETIADTHTMVAAMT
ncbi:nuclear transport factor 2 family protein [Streptomyces javensis]|uniref:Nuclear transport factor 2 family protein n=1 Tax=Streptomyces javensis TaxID=114698 RepID=A0ABP4H3T6_9ACTN